MEKSTRIYAPSDAEGALRQGEIVTNLVQVRLSSSRLDAVGTLQADEVHHPFALVVSQDCDLDWDYKARQQENPEAVPQNKLLPNVLFCETTTAENLRDRKNINSGIWKTIKTNDNERYHFLQRVLSEEDALREGMPELALDFKRYFTIPAEEVYYRLTSEAGRRCRLVSPYVEHLSTRFFNFQARVALPGDHFSEPMSS